MCPEVSYIQLKLIENSLTVRASGFFKLDIGLRVNFTIKQSKYGTYIEFPGHFGKDSNGRNKFYKDFYIEDPTLYEKINSKIISEYKSLSQKGSYERP